MQPIHWGIISMIAAQAMYVTIDACVQFLEIKNYPIFELIFLRNFSGLLPYMAYMALNRISVPINLEKVKLHGLNAWASVFGCFFILYALVIGQLNEVITISFSVVFFVSILSYFMLKEHVSLSRWIATLVGFIGVIIAMKPSGSLVNSATLYALLSCPFNAYGMIKGKQLSLKANTTEVLFYNLLLCAAIGLLALPLGNWIMPTLRDLGLFIVIGGGATLGYTLVIKAYLKAPASVAGPMIYTAMIWSVLFDYYAWGHKLTTHLVIGSIIIIASGIYLIVQKTKHPIEIQASNLP